MTVLWQRGSATVAEVRDALDEPLAYTTVLTFLQILEEKGYVRHEAAGRAYRYFPSVDAAQAGTSALARVRDAMFQGSASRMLAHLVSDRALDRDELKRLRRIIAEQLDGEEDAR
jgi:predicted transcriptional regulator